MGMGESLDLDGAARGRGGYREALDFLYGRLDYERAGMPKGPGDLQDALRVVHVAGTKGKGSTAALIAAALSASGTRTGLSCSPHLHRLEERFAVDGRAIAPEGL